MYSTIVYDLDGTLIDSAATVATLLNDLRAERTLLPLNRDDLTPWLSIGGKGMVAAALSIAEDEAHGYLDVFRARYLALPTDPATLYPDVHKTLSTLKSRGFRLGLCTNKPRQLTDKILAETGLDAYFEAVCAGLDLPTCKPHPDNLHACLNELDSPPEETLLVGDSCVDQALAKACGTGFVFFSGGYDDGVCQENCTLTIQHHAEIFTLIPIQ
ncbi:MAG: HAD-IA family hydrolase [Gammaproteobacteria bacterium]|nr:HAD-IA family hydrolase [Gammaproteobacteria bacterium]MBU1602892.1 HAD-IA family hydrolase [Gammaproteobacteria bacterium]MBU2432564.1 HAD-IA family hydrolase [Gammaproteobacteria bacterium]MBU2448893.1 HAD-IA family hydrolase [Gammaproteobacteria bacterium]